MNLDTVLISKKSGDFHYCDSSQDYHCKEGIIKKEDLQSDKTLVIAHTNREFLKSKVNKYDISQKYKRGAQLITPKDLGYVLARTYLSKNSKIVEAGGGSGAATAFFANYVKEIITYEVSKDNIKIIEKNLGFQGVENVTIKEGDVNEGIDSEENYDMLFLDMPDSHKVLEHDLKGLNKGKYIVCYVPSITQVQAVVEVIKEREDIYLEDISEIIKRDWKVWGSIARPEHRKEIDHTAFLVFLRKL